MTTGQRLAYNNSAQGVSVMRQCPYCGVPVSKISTQCPVCRETISAAAAPAQIAAPTARGGQIRRGLLYMLLAGVIYYFSAGYSAMHVPIVIASVVTAILAPLLFLGGFGLVVYGLLRG
jgi:hypothetical protein